MHIDDGGNDVGSYLPVCRRTGRSAIDGFNQGMCRRRLFRAAAIPSVMKHPGKRSLLLAGWLAGGLSDINSAVISFGSRTGYGLLSSTCR